MKPIDRWRKLGWRHPVWELVRFYRALRPGNARDHWLQELNEAGEIRVDDTNTMKLEEVLVANLVEYIEASRQDFDTAVNHFRDEEEALAYCEVLGVEVLQTKTKSKEHHQSSKALIAAVTAIAEEVCGECVSALDPNPQRRCVWFANDELHVSARNLDGAIPSLLNPIIAWEIKEYWGKTSGGSKMSDAVYECNLVGRELREYEERSKTSVEHVVFLDGKEQWSSRKSDVVRFLDLFHQGLIDHLMIGDEVETAWKSLLNRLIKSRQK